MNSKQREILLKLYTSTNQPGSFGGVERLYKQAKKKDEKITRKNVKDFLRSQSSYTLHKTTFKRFPRRRVMSPKPKVILSIDLADMRLLSRYNNNVQYLLVVIDIFSRFLKVKCLKKKDGTSVTKALKSVLESDEFDGVKKINSDLGKEFYNKQVLSYLKSKNITLYSVHSIEIKASIAERVIRTLKSRIYRYMTHNNTFKYVGVLNNIVESYNNSPHRGLGNNQTPSQIHGLFNNDEIILQFNRMYKKDCQTKKRIISGLAVGETVRISDSERNKPFRRGFKIQNSIEIFRIRKIDKSYYPTVYYLEDLKGDEIEGVFYRQEIIPCQLPEFYNIDIIKSKVIRGKKYFLVRWKGYPEQFNSWIEESNVKKL